MSAMMKNGDGYQKGQALVEFALILPLLVLLTLGAVEFSRAWEVKNVVTGAAREGVRVAAVTTPDAGAVTDRVNEVLDAADLTAAQIVLTGPSGISPNQTVSVFVRVDFTVLVGSIIPGFSGTVPIESEAVMRFEE